MSNDKTKLAKVEEDFKDIDIDSIPMDKLLRNLADTLGRNQEEFIEDYHKIKGGKK